MDEKTLPEGRHPAGRAVAPGGDEPVPSRSPSSLDALACYGATGAEMQKKSHTNVWLRTTVSCEPPSVEGARFDWDPGKDHENQRKHGVAFAKAQFAFADPRRIIAESLPQLWKEAVLLLPCGRGWDSDRLVYVPGHGHTNLWGRLLTREDSL